MPTACIYRRGLTDFQLQTEFIRNHRDKLGIGGFATAVVNGITEIGVEHVHVSPVPRHFYGMSDGPFHTG